MKTLVNIDYDEYDALFEDYREIDFAELKTRMSYFDWMDLMYCLNALKSVKKERERITKLDRQCGIFESHRIYRNTLKIVEENQRKYDNIIRSLIAKY